MKGGIIVGFFSNINKVFSDTDIVVQERLDTVEACFNITLVG